MRCEGMPCSVIATSGRRTTKRPTWRVRNPQVSAGMPAMRNEPARRARNSSANCEIRLRPTKVRSTSANRWPASAVGASRLPRRSNSASLSVTSRSRMSRLTAGCVTCIVVAADVTLPVVMTARNASTCLGLSIDGPCLMARHKYNISVFHMRIIRFDLIKSAWEHSFRDKTGSFPTMRTVFLILTGGAARASGDGARAQTKTLYVGAYGGWFEQTRRGEITPPFEKKYGVKIEYVAGNSTDTLAKLQAQKGNQQIDVAIVDDGPMYQAVALGFCRDLAKAPIYDDIYDVAKFSSNKAVGLGMGGTGIMYAKKVFDDNKWPAPTSWEDLKDPKFAKKLVIPPLNNSYGLHSLVMMAKLLGRSEKSIDPGFKSFKDAFNSNGLAYEPRPGEIP